MDWTATLAATGVVVAALAAAAGIWTARTVWREAALRTRPWGGLSGVGEDLASGTGLIPRDTIIIKHNNVGALPALDVDIDVTFAADTSLIYDIDPVTKSTRKALGTIFPSEASDEHFRFDLGQSPFEARRGSVSISGFIRYRSGKTKYETAFEATAKFMDRDLQRPIEWRNRGAI